MCQRMEIGKKKIQGQRDRKEGKEGVSSSDRPVHIKVFGEFELPELNSRKNTFYGLSWYELDKWLAC